MMKETRDFVKNEDGTITVEVKTQDVEVYLPIDGEQKTVGKSNGTQIQVINDVETFTTFLEDQLKQSEQQITELKKKLEELKDVNEDLIPESILQELSSYMSKKANKQKWEKIKALNNYVTKIYNKRSYQRQLEHMQKIHEDLVEQNKKLELIL